MSHKDSEALEEQLVQDLLDGLNDSVTPAVLGAGEAGGRSTDHLVREYLEVFGLLGLEPESGSVPADLKSRILASLEPGDTKVTSPRTGSGDEPVTGEVVALSSRRKAGWILPLAAGLAIALLGVTLWQTTHLSQQQTTIEKLSDRLHAANLEIADASVTIQDLRQAADNLALVSSPGVEVCSLRPGDAAEAQKDARGTLFVAADHTRWYLKLEGLVPCPLGREHQIWFVTRNGKAVSGGLFEVEPGQGIEIAAELMPEETVAIMITLEPEGGSEQPTGPSVLYGDEVMRIL